MLRTGGSTQKLIDLYFYYLVLSYTVVSSTSDCGGSNIELWSVLGITPISPQFPHPVTGNPIFYMPDVPHLLKLIRNWLLDRGFILNDGRIVSREPLDALAQSANKSEIHAAFKLLPHHVECKKAQRQNVQIAAELLSHTVDTALIRLSLIHISEPTRPY